MTIEEFESQMNGALDTLMQEMRPLSKKYILTILRVAAEAEKTIKLEYLTIAMVMFMKKASQMNLALQDEVEKEAKVEIEAAKAAAAA